MTFFFQLVISGLSLGMMYALIGVGFVIIFKCSQAFNIASGQIVMLGGYLGYTPDAARPACLGRYPRGYRGEPRSWA